MLYQVLVFRPVADTPWKLDGTDPQLLLGGAHMGYTTECDHPKHQNWFPPIQVRRAQLQNLLANEQGQYAEELNNIGKTFHTQRL